MRILLLLAALISGAVAVAHVKVKMSKTEAHIADDLTIKCTARFKEGLDSFRMLQWVKKVNDKVISIAFNFKLEDNFEKEGRYFVNITEEADNTIIAHLRITDVQPRDSGEIGCSLVAKAGYKSPPIVWNNFTVYADIEKLTLKSNNSDGQLVDLKDGETIVYDEGEPRQFHCHVKGGFPEPVVKIMANDTDITDLFKKTIVPVKSAEIKPELQDIKYDIRLENDSFNVIYKYGRKRISCVAEVKKSGFEKQSVGINVQLNEYGPKFDCHHEYTTALHQEDYKIRCHVKADPPVKRIVVYWMPPGDTNIKLVGGEKDGHYQASIESVDEYEQVMVLSIDRVYDQHFRKYYFEAENSVANETHIVSLLKDGIYLPVGNDTTTISDGQNGEPGSDESKDGASAIVLSTVTYLACLLLLAVGL